MSTGILAIWNDCAAGHEAAYEDWYRTEHFPERLAIPGFLRGRRYRAVAGAPEYFTYYETTDPGVLSSPAYLDRVNNPTPLTRRIMAESFLNMNRTACRVDHRQGDRRGDWAVTLRLTAAPGAAARDQVRALTGDPAIARAEIWTALGPASETTESRLRGGDKCIGACLFVEAETEQAAHQIHTALRDAQVGWAHGPPGRPEGAIHRLIQECIQASDP